MKWKISLSSRGKEPIMVLVLATGLSAFFADKTFSAPAKDFEVQVAQGTAEFSRKTKALRGECGATTPDNRAKISCPRLGSTVRVTSSQWVFLGHTSTRSWCKGVAHGLGFKYYWAQPTFDRYDRYRCYGGNSLWPF